MNKKKWLNSKIFSTIIVLFVVCCLMATSSWAARKVDFYKANAGSFIEKLNQNESTESDMIAPLLGLTRDEAFTLLRQGTDLNKVTHYRYQQTYKEIPVWGIQTVISRAPSNQVVRLHGAMILDVPKDIKNIPSSLDPRGALKQMEEQHKKIDTGATWTFINEEYGTYIYLHKDKKARLCYVVSFFADTESGNPSQPIFFIDAKNGKVLDSFDMLRYAFDGTGPGGNQKVGQYYYGTDYSKFGVSINGSTCTMNYADCKSVNLNHGTSGTTPYSYTCYENTFKEINGAYSPINDAQFFGQAVYNMYQDWYSTPVLPFQLMMRVHYSTNYENAFWNGSSMTFGDGYTTFYPLVCLDVSAHEVAHGFTENHSGLIYSSQSGGINESYSDMAGEAAEYYMRGDNDFMCGYDIFKNPSGALRYLYDPPLDGQSIDHVDDYYSGMDVHYSSGVFNKAFYLIAVSPGWTTKMAFDVFTKANMDYWVPGSTFVQGAEGAQDAAADLGYSCTAVRDAFANVGITLVCAGQPVANFSGTPTSGCAPLTVNFTDLSSNGPTSWSWSFPGGTPSSSTDQNPSVTYNTAGTYTVTLTATNASGSDGETKTNYITVCPPQIPDADFTASSTSISVGDSVTFTDDTLHSPTSWSWTFKCGTPATSTAQNPVVQYNSLGTFDVTLTATNAQGSDTETKVGYITVSVKPYCASQGTTYSYEWIAGVQVGDLNNPSGAAPYSDFTNQTAHITQGKTVNVSLTPGFSSSSYTEYWKIWIDYNGDNDFDDAGEEVFSSSGSSVITGSFSVACSTLIGNTRLRVSMKYGSYPTPCETFTYGEVEDYTANIASKTSIVGYSDLFANISTTDNRRAQPVTMPHDGTIESVTMYHEAVTGSNHMILAVYDGEGSPQNRLGLTEETLVNGCAGWQTIDLTSPVEVMGGSTIWLAWVYEQTEETITGIRYQDGTPGRYQSSQTWGGGMPDPFGTGTQDDYIYSIYATYTIPDTNYIVGYSDVFTGISTTDNRRAQPVTMPQDGCIESVSMYHAAGSCEYNMILAVYDGEGFPQNRIAITPTTPISGITGWQTIDLISPVEVMGGSTIWLAWVYEQTEETITGIRYQDGTPGRYQSSQTWGGGMPDPFGTGTQDDYIYSIYATYSISTTCTVGYRDVFSEISTSDTRRAQPFTMPENGTIVSVTMYHEAGNGSDHMILAVYDGEDSPQNRLGLTEDTLLNVCAGWQTIDLISPVPVTGGSTIWLAWVYEQSEETTTGIRYQIGTPGRYQSSQTWGGGMPDPFGGGTQADNIYSIYATYITTTVCEN